MTQLIFLVGPRGCGKTTVGHALAKVRSFKFADTDHELQEHEQRTVAAIVQQEGWERFRALETQALERVAQPATIIATGGGIILSEYNRQFMRENGVVIYLEAEQRPTLTGKPIREEVGEVLAQREALYRAAAHHIINATASPDEVVEQIMATVCGVSYTS